MDERHRELMRGFVTPFAERTVAATPERGEIV